jgi:hypothetical protein
MSNNQENDQENTNNSYIFNSDMVDDDDFIDMPQLIPYSQIVTSLQTIDIFYINSNNFTEQTTNFTEQTTNFTEQTTNINHVNEPTNTISHSSSISSLPDLVELDSNLTIPNTSTIFTQPMSSMGMASYIFSYINQNSNVQSTTTQPTIQPTTSAYPYTSGYIQYSSGQPTTSSYPYTSGYSQYSSGQPTTISTYQPIQDQYINTTFIPTINNSNILIQSTNGSVFMNNQIPILSPSPYLNTTMTTHHGFPGPNMNNQISTPTPSPYLNSTMTSHQGFTGPHMSTHHGGTGTYYGGTGTNHGGTGTNHCGMNGKYNDKLSCIYDNFSFNAISKGDCRVYTLKYNGIVYEVIFDLNNMSPHKDNKLQKFVSKIENILKTTTDITLLSMCKSILKKDVYISNLIKNRIVIKI